MNMSLGSALDQVLVGSAAIAGLVQCIVSGDFAALFYAFAFTGLYAIAHQWKIETPLKQCLILTGTYAGSALFCTVAYRLSPVHPLAGYPGPWTWWISSLRLVYTSFTGRRHLKLDALHAKYGPIVRIGPNTLTINTLTANLMYNAAHNMDKSDSYLAPGHTGAVSLFFKQKTKEIHSTRKRIWSPAFTSASIAKFIPALDRRTWQLIKCIENRQGKDGVVELSDCLCHWAYDVMGEIVFGGSSQLELMRDGDPESIVEGGKRAMVVVDAVGHSQWLMDIIWHLPAGKYLHRLRHLAAEILRRRIQADKEVDLRDLSSHLLAGDPETGEQIPQKDLEVDALVAIQAGSDNTSTTVAHVFYFLLSERKYYLILKNEIDQAFSDKTGHLDAAQLTSLTFLNAVLHETLRLCTPFYLPRIVPEGGATISGKFIPQGTNVALAAYSQQTSLDNFYPDPMDFRPERWCVGGLGPGSKTEKGALASFSFGPHVCIARNLAYQEMRFVVARLVLTFDMSLPDSFDIKGFRNSVLNMRTTFTQPLMVRVLRRPGLDIEQSL